MKARGQFCPREPDSKQHADKAVRASLLLLSLALGVEIFLHLRRGDG